MNKTAVIVLNWNGEQDSLNCIASLCKQDVRHDIIVVDNNSDDNLVTIIESDFPEIKIIKNNKNLGFSGGENTGIRYALSEKYEFIALINNDATANPGWLRELLSQAKDSSIGIVTGKLLKTDELIDSTGDTYTSWGLPYPRGRNEEDKGQYDRNEFVFSASGGASLYRSSMLEDIGLFDEDFFAYYEDVDLSFRAQLAGWKIRYTPKAIAHHKVGASSSKVPGLTTYMTVKNLPWLLLKNVPMRLMPTLLPRFTIAYAAIVFSSLSKGKLVPVAKGLFMTSCLMPKKILQRVHIQRSKKVDTKYIESIITHDLPPTAYKLHKLRSYLTSRRP